MQFKCHTHGKWILSGEHTVLRGGFALAFPVFTRKMELSFERGEKNLEIIVEGEQDEILSAFLRQVLHHGMRLLHRKSQELGGYLKLANSIPLGTGLGASAALSVNIARLFAALNWIDAERLFEMARNLENLAHGTSSGVDIATVMSPQGIYFAKDQPWQNFTPLWRPQLHLLYSGQRGLTSQCISQVENILRTEPETGARVDADMKKSVQMCKQALEGKNDLPRLQAGIQLAETCFERWGLIGDELKERADFLKHHGALAVKPVGSGGGGYLLGLWAEKPPAAIADQLIPCFQ